MIAVRNYHPHDYAAVKAILQQADMFDEVWDSEANFASMLQQDSRSIQVAEVENNIVGLVIIDNHGEKTKFFYRLAVTPDKRGGGIGSALLQKAEEIAKDMGAEEVAVYVEADNTIVQRFYTYKGYQTSGKKFICMWKSLENSTT